MPRLDDPDAWTQERFFEGRRRVEPNRAARPEAERRRRRGHHGWN